MNTVRDINTDLAQLAGMMAPQENAIPHQPGTDTATISYSANDISDQASRPAIILDSPGSGSPEDFLVTLMVLKEQLQKNKLQLTKNDIRALSHLSDIEKQKLIKANEQVANAAENTLEARSSSKAANKALQEAQGEVGVTSNALKNAIDNENEMTIAKVEASQNAEAASANALTLNNEANEAEAAATVSREIADQKQETLNKDKAAAEAASKIAEEKAAELKKAEEALAANNSDPELKSAVEKAKVELDIAQKKLGQANGQVRISEQEVEQAVSNANNIDQLAADKRQKADDAAETARDYRAAEKDAVAALQTAKALTEDASNNHDAATSKLTAASDVAASAKARLNQAEAAESAAIADTQALELAYLQMQNWSDSKQTAVLDDFLKLDTQGAAAALKALLTSGSAIATVLTTEILQNSASREMQTGLSHSTRMELLNKAAELESLSKISEQTEKSVLKTEIAADMAQLFVGMIAAFSVFGKGRFNEVAAITPELLSRLSDMNGETVPSNSPGKTAKGGLKSVSTEALSDALPLQQFLSSLNLSGKTVADVASSIASVFDNAMALLGKESDIAKLSNTRYERSVTNKV